MRKIRKSPFPGMDPYLERRWGDVHTRLCTYISAALQPNLPDGLRARAQEDVLLENYDDNELQNYEPDIAIVETAQAENSEKPGSINVAIKPVAIRHVRRHKRTRWVEILDSADSKRVVTAIEILSADHKASGGVNRNYREKVEQYLEGGTNVVEIELLRSSRKRLTVPTDEIPEVRRADYYVCLCRANDPDLWLVYPMPLRLPLVTIPIPCRETDADVPLELQPIIDRIYVEGAHDDLKYNEPPEPPFSPIDAEWAAGIIADRKGAL